MTVEIERLPRAIADLDDIHDYIAQFDLDAADRIVDRIVASTERLCTFPRRGTPRPEIARSARSIPVGNYIVLFRATESMVTIVRIMHGARDVREARADFD